MTIFYCFFTSFSILFGVFRQNHRHNNEYIYPKNIFWIYVVKIPHFMFMFGEKLIFRIFLLKNDQILVFFSIFENFNGNCSCYFWFFIKKHFPPPEIYFCFFKNIFGSNSTITSF